MHGLAETLFTDATSQKKTTRNNQAIRILDSDDTPQTRTAKILPSDNPTSNR